MEAEAEAVQAVQAEAEQHERVGSLRSGIVMDRG